MSGPVSPEIQELLIVLLKWQDSIQLLEMEGGMEGVDLLAPDASSNALMQVTKLLGFISARPA